MTARYFVDTNVLLYAASHDPAESAKRDQANDVLRSPNIGISAQVLNEFVANALSKQRLGISEANIEAVLKSLAYLPCVSITPSLVQAALQIRSRFQISYWDACILAAAQELHCDTLYTEDLSHGQNYDGIQVINPFVGLT